ncbi:MAG: hypothetical protein IPJ69_03195 [Deltaproteobacteria bacterium]|nr:MAG: hypothetical protein IPJ69_03195 [Deltaproteobacteria bacterium]
MKILIKTTILSNKNLQCVVYYDNQEIASDTIETIALASSLSYIFPWFLNLCRPIFDLPLALFIDVKIIGDKTISDQLLPALQAALNVIQGTRKALLQTSKFEILSQGFQANLFLNLGETLFVKRIYETIHERDPENNFYDPCHFLNDLSDKSSSCINLDGLLETIFEKRIAHVYIHNFSLLNHYLASHQIHLPTIFEKLGIELIILDFDTYDQREGEIFLKSMLHSNSSRHYCVMPHIESYWDKKMGLKNIHYFTFPYKIENKPFDTLQEDYSFMITTWARLKHLFHFFQPLLLFMSYVDFSNPFLDYQILTHGLTYLIKKNTLLPLALKMRYFTLVSNLYYQANSLLKFETLQKINTKRPVYLYGEDDWNIFSQNITKDKHSKMI